MADHMTAHFLDTTMILQFVLKPQARIVFVLVNCVVRDAGFGCVSVYTHRRIVGTTFQQSESACTFFFFEKKKTHSHCSSSDFEECRQHEFQFFMKKSAMMKTTTTKYAAGLHASLYTISILFSDQYRSQNLHFLLIVDSYFDAFACCNELVCRVALFLP